MELLLNILKLGIAIIFGVGVVELLMWISKMVEKFWEDDTWGDFR